MRACQRDLPGPGVLPRRRLQNVRASSGLSPSHRRRDRAFLPKPTGLLPRSRKRHRIRSGRAFSGSAPGHRPTDRAFLPIPTGLPLLLSRRRRPGRLPEDLVRRELRCHNRITPLSGERGASVVWAAGPAWRSGSARVTSGRRPIRRTLQGRAIRLGLPDWPVHAAVHAPARSGPAIGSGRVLRTLPTRDAAL
jgi:hypothetical protein